MLNLMKSEQYRFVRTRNYYFTGLLYTLLMAGAAVILYVFQQSEPGFRYGNERFFYSNVLAMMPVVFVLLFTFPLILMGEHKQMLKNTAAYGFSRQRIYTAKLLVILAGFLIFALALTGVSVLLGASLLVRSHEHALAEYSRSLVSVLPVMIAGITTYYGLAAVMKKNTQIITAYVLIYFLPHYVLNALQSRFAWAEWLYSHNPVYYLFNLYNSPAYPAWEPWTSGAVYTLVFCGLGLYLFSKEEF
ncbi:ABC transporter permease subunit [Paenibacillus tengchongensis]|uniref:ABC transporter permease subunit n=1 Tax=Paenibacillus tengchongensis TaxID=2608684 RepID=UPI00124E4593|nr:ABC transporter permease subunit [Paenibacillus tengchongensis]